MAHKLKMQILFRICKTKVTGMDEQCFFHHFKQRLGTWKPESGDLQEEDGLHPAHFRENNSSFETAQRKKQSNQQETGLPSPERKGPGNHNVDKPGGSVAFLRGTRRV